MERQDLVYYEHKLCLADQTVKFWTHMGTDLDEIMAMFFIINYASAEWIEKNSQNKEIWLGVGEASQRGVFNEHRVRDQEGNKENCCATLVARSLGIIDNPELQPLLVYILGQDNRGQGSQYDLAAALKAWRNIGGNNTEAIAWGINGLTFWTINRQHWPITDSQRIIWDTMGSSQLDVLTLGARRYEWCRVGLDVFAEQERLTQEMIPWIKANAEPHRVGTKNPMTFWVVRNDSPITLRACRVIESPDCIVRIKSDGRFQVMVRRNPLLYHRTFWEIVRRMYLNKNWFSEAVRARPTSGQIRYLRDELPTNDVAAWEKYLYAHADTGMIMNGAHTAAPPPLIGDNFTVADLCDAITDAMLYVMDTRQRRQERRQAPVTKPQSGAHAAPATPTSTPGSAPATPDPPSPATPAAEPKAEGEPS